MDIQDSLWHETLADALRAVAMAYGPKKLGAELWPSKRADDAARLLNHCLDDERSEKLALAEVEYVVRKGREIGVHTGMAYLAQVCGYQPPVTLEPEDERARLQREFTQATAAMARMVSRMEALNHA